MDAEHEEHALALVLERLHRRFPELAPEVVEAAVDDARARLTGPIRDFVPLLVERAATERLRAAAAVTGPSAPAAPVPALPTSQAPAAPAAP